MNEKIVTYEQIVDLRLKLNRIVAGVVNDIDLPSHDKILISWLLVIKLCNWLDKQLDREANSSLLTIDWVDEKIDKWLADGQGQKLDSELLWRLISGNYSAVMTPSDSALRLILCQTVNLYVDELDVENRADPWKLIDRKTRKLADEMNQKVRKLK